MRGPGSAGMVLFSASFYFLGAVVCCLPQSGQKQSLPGCWGNHTLLPQAQYTGKALAWPQAEQKLPVQPDAPQLVQKLEGSR